MIEVTSTDDPAWWIGRLNGKTGTFPASYTEKLPDSEGGSAQAASGGGGTPMDEKPGGDGGKSGRRQVTALYDYDAEGEGTRTVCECVSV